MTPHVSVYNLLSTMEYRGPANSTKLLISRSCARGRRIRNITHTNTVTTVYEEGGGRPSVRRTSTRTSSPSPPPVPPRRGRGRGRAHGRGSRS